MAGNTDVSFGILLPQGWRLDLPAESSSGEQWRILVDAAKKIESLGFGGLWVYDHFHTFPIKEERSVFEAWTTLTALAGLTKTIRLGQLVTCYAYRSPAILAKMSSCLDVISNGRLEFGIGAGWYEDEFSAYGLPYPKAAVRIAQLRETVQIVKNMWTEHETTFSGKYYKIRNTLNYPKPIQKPHPPITIGGGGEKLTLRVVAEHGDRWNIDLGCGLGQSKHKLSVLRDHCKSAGRDFDEIEISIHRDIMVGEDKKKIELALGKEYEMLCSWYREHNRLPIDYETFVRGRKFHGSPVQCAEQMKEFVKLGVSHFVMYVRDLLETRPLRLIAEEVIPAVIRR